MGVCFGFFPSVGGQEVSHLSRGCWYRGVSGRKHGSPALPAQAEGRVVGLLATLPAYDAAWWLHALRPAVPGGWLHVCRNLPGASGVCGSLLNFCGLSG